MNKNSFIILFCHIEDNLFLTINNCRFGLTLERIDQDIELLEQQPNQEFERWRELNVQQTQKLKLYVSINKIKKKYLMFIRIVQDSIDNANVPLANKTKGQYS